MVPDLLGTNNENVPSSVNAQNGSASEIHSKSSKKADSKQSSDKSFDRTDSNKPVDSIKSNLIPSNPLSNMNSDDYRHGITVNSVNSQPEISTEDRNHLITVNSLNNQPEISTDDHHSYITVNSVNSQLEISTEDRQQPRTHTIIPDESSMLSNIPNQSTAIMEIYNQEVPQPITNAITHAEISNQTSMNMGDSHPVINNDAMSIEQTNLANIEINNDTAQAIQTNRTIQANLEINNDTSEVIQTNRTIQANLEINNDTAQVIQTHHTNLANLEINHADIFEARHTNRNPINPVNLFDQTANARSIHFVNKTKSNVFIVKENRNNVVIAGHLAAGGTCRIISYVGHRWMAVDKDYARPRLINSKEVYIVPPHNTNSIGGSSSKLEMYLHNNRIHGVKMADYAFVTQDFLKLQDRCIEQILKKRLDYSGNVIPSIQSLIKSYNRRSKFRLR